MTATRWTAAKLRRVLQSRFGSNIRGHVDAAAAAQGLGVSKSTVYRWLHAPSGRATAHIPDTRVHQLLTLLQVDEETLRIEAQQARLAHKAIARIADADPRDVWLKQRWIEPHRVVVLQLSEPRIRQITIARVDGLKTKVEKRGRVVQQLVVPTKFHATILVHDILESVGPWRFRAGTGQVEQGFTQAWMPGAPTIRLSEIATTLGLLKEGSS